jgi:hypothetical protein
VEVVGDVYRIVVVEELMGADLRERSEGAEGEDRGNYNPPSGASAGKFSAREFWQGGNLLRPTPALG